MLGKRHTLFFTRCTWFISTGLISSVACYMKQQPEVHRKSERKGHWEVVFIWQNNKVLSDSSHGSGWGRQVTHQKLMQHPHKSANPAHSCPQFVQPLTRGQPLKALCLLAVQSWTDFMRDSEVSLSLLKSPQCYPKYTPISWKHLTFPLFPFCQGEKPFLTHSIPWINK